MIGEVKLEAIGVNASAHSLPKPLAADIDLTCLHHLIGAQSIQVRKGNLPDQLVKRILFLETTSLDVLEVV